MTPLVLFPLLYSLCVLTIKYIPISSFTSPPPSATKVCTLQNSFQPGFVTKGDYVIGGIFPLHYNQEMPDLNCTYRPPPVKCNGAFRWAQTMRLAVEEINQSAELLPNYTLGYKIFDSCAYPLTGQRAAVAVLNGLSEDDSPVCSGASPLLAVIGESGSAQSIVVSRILQPFRIPMISYFSSCACLTDRRQYPTFFRVIPNDDYQVKAIAQLLLRFNWTWVGLVRGDHEYGRFAVQGLLRELQEIISHHVPMSLAQCHLVLTYFFSSFSLCCETLSCFIICLSIKVMRSSSAKVVVVFSAEGEMTPFLRDYMKQNITGIQWVASEAWVTASVFTGSEYYPYLGGTIGFGIRKGHISRLSDYLQTVNPQTYPNNILVKELWEALYGCNPSLSVAYNVILYDLLVSKLQHYIQEVTFNIAGEEVNFDLKGDSIPYYDILNWQRGTGGNIEFVNVGLFDGTKPGGEELVIQEDRIMWAGHQSEASCSHYSIECTFCPEDFWSNNDRTACIPKKVEFLAYDSIGLALTVISVVGACLTIVVFAVFFYHRNTAIVRVNNCELSFFILFALTLCFLCSLVFIGEPTTWSCMLRHTAFSITFSLCISCILGKTLVVLAAFTATRPGDNIMKWLGPKQQRAIIFSCTLIQVVICAVWLINAPPFPSRNTQYERSKIILECSVGSSLAFWCVLGYIGLQACLCFVLAFLARRLPGKFNEAKFITFSILIFCAVWLAFIPAYISSPGMYADSVESFAILASSFGLLFCLFAPKCYIILLKPEKNTKQHLMGKEKNQNGKGSTNDQLQENQRRLKVTCEYCYDQKQAM
uniref:Olfactory receptor C family, v3 n=1 Tax=Sander lucioperca TaxID=283035 RepID=A0A8D0DAR6_SANLU